MGYGDVGDVGDCGKVNSILALPSCNLSAISSLMINAAQNIVEPDVISRDADATRRNSIGKTTAIRFAHNRWLKCLIL